MHSPICAIAFIGGDVELAGLAKLHTKASTRTRRTCLDSWWWHAVGSVCLIKIVLVLHNTQPLTLGPVRRQQNKIACEECIHQLMHAWAERALFASYPASDHTADSSLIGERLLSRIVCAPELLAGLHNHTSGVHRHRILFADLATLTCLNCLPGRFVSRESLHPKSMTSRVRR